MTRLEHLLGKIAEECAELAQRCSKAQRFGVWEIQPGQELTNVERMEVEFNDVLASVELLNAELVKTPEAGIVTDNCTVEANRTLINTAKRKVEQYLDYSRKVGTLNDGHTNDTVS